MFTFSKIARAAASFAVLLIACPSSSTTLAFVASPMVRFPVGIHMGLFKNQAGGSKTRIGSGSTQPFGNNSSNKRGAKNIPKMADAAVSDPGKKLGFIGSVSFRETDRDRQKCHQAKCTTSPSFMLEIVTHFFPSVSPSINTTCIRVIDTFIWPPINNNITHRIVQGRHPP